MLLHKDAAAQEVFKVVEKGIDAAIRLGILCELILQDVAHNGWIIGQQGVWRWAPREAQVFANGPTLTDFQAPVMQAVQVPLQVPDPTRRGVMACTLGGGHILQHFSHARGDRKAFPQTIKDLNRTKDSISNDLGNRMTRQKNTSHDISMVIPYFFLLENKRKRLKQSKIYAKMGSSDAIDHNLLCQSPF